MNCTGNAIVGYRSVRGRVLVSALLALALAAGCRSLVGAGDDGPTPSGGWHRRVGLVFLFSGVQAPDPLAAPAEAVRGKPVAITVTTHGSGSCTRPSGGEVRYESLVPGLTVAVVTPYDEYLEGDNVVCTDDLRTFPRQLTLRFPTAGVAHIRLVARAAGLGVTDPLTLRAISEREITVRP